MQFPRRPVPRGDTEATSKLQVPAEPIRRRREAIPDCPWEAWMMPHKHTFSGSMNHDHRCDALDEWSADPRSPIKLVENPSRYELVLHLRNRLEMVFCPFCGGELAGRAHAPRSEASCDHLKKLSRET